MQEISTITAQIQKAVTSFYGAYSSKDDKRLRALLAPDWTGFGPGAQLQATLGKDFPTYLKAQLPGLANPGKMEVLWVKVRVHDDRLAWAEGEAKSPAPAPSGPGCSHRFTMAFGRKTDCWQLMHGHWSLPQEETPCQEKQQLQKLQEQLLQPKASSCSTTSSRL